MNLPQPPMKMLMAYKEKTNLWPEGNVEDGGRFYRTCDECEEINAWCKENICDTMVFGVHRIMRDLPVHFDKSFVKNDVTIHAESKLTYLVDTGGKDVITSFWTEDKQLMLKKYKIEPFRWHILKCNQPHGVDGIKGCRWGVSSQILHNLEDY